MREGVVRGFNVNVTGGEGQFCGVFAMMPLLRSAMRVIMLMACN